MRKHTLRLYVYPKDEYYKNGRPGVPRAPVEETIYAETYTELRQIAKKRIRATGHRLITMPFSNTGIDAKLEER